MSTLDAIRTWLQRPFRYLLCERHKPTNYPPCTCNSMSRPQTCAMCKQSFLVCSENSWLYLMPIADQDCYHLKWCHRMGGIKDYLQLPAICTDCRGDIYSFCTSFRPFLNIDCPIFPTVLNRIIGEYAFEKLPVCPKCISKN